MKKRFTIILLIFINIFVIQGADWIDLPAVIKLKYNSTDSCVIGQIDNLNIDNNSNCIRFYGKILHPIKNSDQYSINIDSVIVTGESFYQKLVLEDGISLIRVFGKKDIWQDEYSIKIVDVNKDHYPDIAIFNDVWSGNSNHTYNYYLYNPKSKLFKVNHNFSLPNLIWDEKSRTYSSFGVGGRASMIYTFDTYRIENDSLIPIKTVTQDYNKKLDKYIRVTKTLEKSVIDTLTIKN